MTPADKLHALREALARGTKGRWYAGNFTVGGTDVGLWEWSGPEPNSDDAALIVAAINALPALLDVAEAAQSVIYHGEMLDLDALAAALARLGSTTNDEKDPR